MNRPLFLLALPVAVLMVLPFAASAGEAPAPGPTAFEAAKITMDCKDMKATNVLKEIERQAGFSIPRGKTVADPVLAEFKAAGEAFWPVFDRLCEASGNIFEPEKTSG